MCSFEPSNISLANAALLSKLMLEIEFVEKMDGVEEDPKKGRYQFILYEDKEEGSSMVKCTFYSSINDDP